MTAPFPSPEGSDRENGTTALAEISTTADSTTAATPAEASAPAVEDTAPAPTYERVDLDRYVVLIDGPVGYVESVPPLFVCYVGDPYPQACEIAQVHDFHHAIDTVIDHVVSARRSKISA